MLIDNATREFLEQPRCCVMATINRDGTPQQTVMWFALDPVAEVIHLNFTRGCLKERNLRRDNRMSISVEDGFRYVTLSGRADVIEDRQEQERDVNELIAPRYIGQRLGSQRWEVIKGSDRLGVRMRVENVHARV